PGVLIDVRAGLEAAAYEMDATLCQAAFSAAIGRQGGSAAGFYAETGSLILGGRESHPLLLEVAAEALAFLVHQGAASGCDVAAGDLYWTNDPRCKAAGLEDLVLASPVVRGGRAVGFVAVTATHTALGRATLAPVERLRREGLILPWTRVGRDGAVQSEILDLLAANVEEPAGFLEDLRAQIHSLRLGHAVMEALVDCQGPEALALICDSLGAGIRRTLQGILGKLEQGCAEGRVAPFTVRIKAEDDEVSVVATAEAPASRPHPTPALGRAAVRPALREILTAEVPAMSVLGGLFDAVRVETSWDPLALDVPMGAARFSGAQALAESVLAAFAEGLAHLTRAPDASPVLLDLRGERADGTRYRMRLEVCGGLGASVFGDGMTHASPGFQPRRLCSIEAIERAAPLRVLHFELRPDSAGPGQYRGGLGAGVTLEFLEGRATVDV
ncbi:MAG: hydantoinase B/oxoprolinase family protein, partial [candidate division NC10 bacterium]|nr:hydantoinase B/oxoprolinase family protein [candidate division NC10 bacterium]